MKRLILLIPLLAVVAAAQTNCNLSLMPGTYAVSYSGWVTVPMPGAAPVTVPGSILGVISIGYDGKINGAGSVAIAPGPSMDYDVSGTIQINSDCTGTLRLNTKPRLGGPAGTAGAILLAAPVVSKLTLYRTSPMGRSRLGFRGGQQHIAS